MTTSTRYTVTWLDVIVMVAVAAILVALLMATALQRSNLTNPVGFR